MKFAGSRICQAKYIVFSKTLAINQSLASFDAEDVSNKVVFGFFNTFILFLTIFFS